MRNFVSLFICSPESTFHEFKIKIFEIWVVTILLTNIEIFRLCCIKDTSYISLSAPPTQLTHNVTLEEWDVNQKYFSYTTNVICWMLASITPNMKKQHKVMDARSILLHLKELVLVHVWHEKYEVSKSLYRSKMSDGSQVGLHVLKMIAYAMRLLVLSFCMNNDLDIDLVYSPYRSLTPNSSWISIWIVLTNR